MTKMNPEVKAKWVAALRSGKYEQGKDALCKDGKFCCLGVLCDLSGLHEWEMSLADPLKRTYGDNTGMPPAAVWKWAGFQVYPRWRLVIDGKETSLDAHNDEGKSFAQIADAIEAQL